MAALLQSRLVSANTRDGVDTRKQENREIRKTICRSDMIIGLGVPTVYWGDMMTGMYASQSIPAIEHSPYNAVRLYRDMADEPWKYGDDIGEWDDMDNELRDGPDCQEVFSYWQERQDSIDLADGIVRKMWKKRFNPIASETAHRCLKLRVARDIHRHVHRIGSSIRRIQAAVRGHQTRSRETRRDCCMCLSHRMCPLRTAVGYMCRDCGAMGPYEDVMDRDPWNWHRAEYVDETA